MQTRREMLNRSAGVAAMLAGLGMLPAAARAEYAKAAFDAKTMADVVKSLGLATPEENKSVMLQAPDIAENGAVVPVGCSTTLPGVKRMLIGVEKNPALLCAMFDVTDEVEPSFNTRVKMGQSSNVIAVAVMNDGKVYYSQKEVKVTLGGCGG